jgi:flagellar basal-body rod protein FlgF
MAGGQYVALSGMRTRVDQLDRLAADIANASTAGYKSERTTDAEANRPRFDALLQTAIDVKPGGRRLNTAAGALNGTGRDLDVAIEGNGFFVVDSPAGPRYTRNGNFSRSPEGALVTAEGMPVMGADGPIKLGPGKVHIDADGTIRTGETVAGRLAIVQFDDPSALVRESGATLRADGASARPAANAVIRPGSLEQSNVSVVERVAELTNVTRTFQALQKAVSVLMNDVDGRTIDSLGRRA